jgi:hypothetical protein
VRRQVMLNRDLKKATRISFTEVLISDEKMGLFPF